MRYCSTFSGRLLGLAALLVLGATAAAGQNVSRPDCIIDVTFTAAGQTAGGPGTCGNNINGVYEWRFNYKSTGFTALSVVVQSAPDNAGAPGTWVTFAGATVGSNPNTATTQASTNLVGFYPWVRVLLSSVTGSGTITGQLYGCREPGCSIAGASITAVIPTPVPVDGPTPAGSAPTTPPVLVAGQDGAPGVIRTLKTDSNGSLIPSNGSSAASDGLNNTETTTTGAAGGILYPRVFEHVFNGTTWDRMRGNTLGIFSQGPVASGVANAGNPLKIGGPFNTTQPTVTNGQVVDAQFTPRGALIVAPGVEPFPVAVCGTPGASSCFVQGAAASGAANAGNPVKTGGPFNTTQPTVTNGQDVDAQFTARGAAIVAPGVDGFPVTNTPPVAATAQADGATNTPNVPTGTAGAVETEQTYPRKFNGATWDRDFVCTLSAPITFTAASGSLQIVAASGSTVIRVCHISISASVLTNITIQYGTGSNCGTGTNPLSGAYNNMTAFALDFGGTLRTPASQALCLSSSASITAGGTVTYAQF